MFRKASCLATVILLASTLHAASQSTDANKLWSLEDAYWHYVRAHDLQSYRSLWHPDFLGWPYISPAPLRKDHITDWITTHDQNHETLKSYDLERLSLQVTANVATATYRIRMSWVGKDGAVSTSSIRIIHTWLRDASGAWQIISGMSAPTNSTGH